MLRPDYEAEVRRVWATQRVDGAHDLGHLRRVWSVCQTLAAKMDAPVDLDVLEAASFLHDIVNLPKDHPERMQAASRSADHAVAFLAAFEWRNDRLKNVRHAIEAHSFSCGVMARSLEAKLLQDADRMDALGAIGVARCFNVSGQLGRALFDPDDPLAKERALDDGRYALDHFEAKLFRIADMMQTAPGQAMARARVEFMRDYVRVLMSEVA